MSTAATQPTNQTAQATEPAWTIDQLTFAWRESIEAIGMEAWNRCFNADDVLHSYHFTDAVEHSQLESVRFHYLIGTALDQVQIIIPCFAYPVSLSLLASERIQQIVDRVRRVVPSLLYINTFVIGSPVAICKDLLGIRQLSTPAQISAVLAATKPVILARARASRASFVTIKEIPKPLLDSVRAAFAPEFFFVESLPTTYIPLQGPTTPPYHERMRYKYRLQRRNRIKAFEQAGFRWELASDFAALANDIHRLYLQVLKRASNRFETLTPEFFREISERLGAQSSALLCFKDDQLIAFELFVEDSYALHPLYLGLDYTYRDQGALYFNCVYRIIEEAAKRGYSVIELGQSSYEVKGAMGAFIGRLYIGLYHRNPLMHKAIKHFQDTLFPSLAVPQFNVFSDPREAHAILAHAGIAYEAVTKEAKPS